MKYTFKRKLAAILSLAMLTASFTAVSSESAAKADFDTEGHYIYYGDQLSTEHHYLYNDEEVVARNPQTGAVARIFYDAIAHMYDEGLLRGGIGSLDITDCIDQSIIEAYTNGDNTLLYGLSAGKDAFYADHPEIFYVNFDNLSFVVKINSEGKYILTLGTGRTLSYARPGFEDEESIQAAEAEIEAAANAIIAKAQEDAANAPTAAPTADPDATPTPIPTPDPEATPQIFDMADMLDNGSDREASREKTKEELLVRSVHEQLIHSTSYRLEDYCSKGNGENIRTPYGPLVTHEGLCEGYSRTFKYILDKLGIPCILVNGVYKHSGNKYEAHMWNYVQLNGTWYAVDATFDDPKTFEPKGENGEDGYESNEYLLVGVDVMNKAHTPVGILSANEYEFAYPDLSPFNLSEEIVYSEGGLQVQYSADMDVWTDEGDGSGAYKVSYNGKGYYKAAEEDGMYILVKYYQPSYEKENTNNIKAYNITEWLYPDFTYYGAVDALQPENGSYTLIPAPHITAMEFAVTDVAPQMTKFEGDGYSYEILDDIYHGDPNALIAKTGTLYNPSGTHIAPPYLMTSSTPTQGAKLYVEDGPRDVKLIYTQPLKKVKEDEEVGYQIRYTDIPGSDAHISTEGMITDFKWDGDRIITFKLQPKKDFANSEILYYIKPTNLVGLATNLEPNEASYCIVYDYWICPAKSGVNWNVFGKPQLLEDFDVFDPDNWQLAAHESGFGPNLETISHRLTLVASETEDAATDKINDVLQDESKHKDGSEVPKVLKSDTYNINLMVCQRQVVRTGDKLRVMVGFPDGYHPDQIEEGVTFKAYHFVTDKSGVVTGVEEIKCEVTKYGLILWVDAFSPFVIAAVEGEPEETNEKLILVSNNLGGTVTIDGGEDNGMFKLAEGGQQTITVTPNEGYIIDKITVGKNNIAISNPDEMTVTVNEADVENSDVMDIQFVLKEVHEKEVIEAEETGVEVLRPQIYTPEIIPLDEPEDAPVPSIEDAYWSGAGGTVARIKGVNKGVLVAVKYENNAVKNIKFIDVAHVADETFTFEGITADKIFLWNILSAVIPSKE